MSIDNNYYDAQTSLLTWCRKELSIDDIREICDNASAYEPFSDPYKADRFRARVTYAFLHGCFRTDLADGDAERIGFYLREAFNVGNDRKDAKTVYACIICIYSVIVEGTVIEERLTDFVPYLSSALMQKSDVAPICAGMCFFDCMARHAPSRLKSLFHFASAQIAADLLMKQLAIVDDREDIILQPESEWNSLRENLTICVKRLHRNSSD